MKQQQKKKPYKDGDHQRAKARAKQLKNAAKKKDTRTDAQKMTDATGPLVLATEVTSD